MTKMNFNEKQTQMVRAKVEELRKEAPNSTMLVNVLAKEHFWGDLGEAIDVMTEIKRGRADFRASFNNAKENGMDEAVKNVIDNQLEGKSLEERVEALTKIAMALTGFGIRDEKIEEKIFTMAENTRNLVEGADENAIEAHKAEKAVAEFESCVIELADKSAECALANGYMLDILNTIDEKSSIDVRYDAYQAEEAILYTAVATYLLQDEEEFETEEKLSPHEIGMAAAMGAEIADIRAKVEAGEISEDGALTAIKLIVGVVIATCLPIALCGGVILSAVLLSEECIFLGIAVAIGTAFAILAATRDDGYEALNDAIETGYSKTKGFFTRVKAWFMEKLSAESVGEIVGRAESKINDIKESVGEYTNALNEARRSVGGVIDVEEDEDEGEVVTC